jgi:hypothetical protein
LTLHSTVSQWYYGADPQTPPWIKLGEPNKKIYTQAGWFWAPECWNPHNQGPQQILAVIYFISFPIVVAFVMFSTFIGAVTGGMADAMDEFKKEEEKVKAKKAKKLADQDDPK